MEKDFCIEDLPVRLKVVLGRGRISKEAASQLEVGDVLLLNQKIDRPVGIEIEGLKKWVGYLGHVGANKGVLIDG